MFVLYFDQRYYKWAVPMIESIGIHEPTERVFVHCFDVQKPMFYHLLGLKNVVDGVNVELNYNPENCPKPEYMMICSRAGIVLTVIAKYPKEDFYVITDVDMLMIQSLKHFRKKISHYDVAVVKAESHQKICGGFIASRNTPAAMDFWMKFNYVTMHGNFYYNKDQPLLTQCVYGLSKSGLLNVLFLDRKYMDQFSRESSFIWSAHKKELSTKDERYLQYLRRLEKMRRGANELAKGR